jgi:hypothetical protein
MVRTGDGTITVWDRQLRRLTTFSATGDVVETGPVPGLEELGPSVMSNPPKFFVFPYDLLPLSGGRSAAIMLAEPNIQLIPAGPYTLQDTVPVFLSDGAGKWSQVGGGPYPGNVWYFHNRSGRLFPSYYGERLRYAAADSVFYLTSSRSPTIRRISSVTGAATDFVTLPGPPRPLTDGDREVIRDRMLANNLASEEAFEAMDIPSDLPMLFDLLVSADGDLWVQLFQSRTDTVSTWVMYDQTGEPFGKLTIPAALRLVDVGDDYVLGITMDSLDQETVNLYEISPE